MYALYFWTSMKHPLITQTWYFEVSFLNQNDGAFFYRKPSGQIVKEWISSLSLFTDSHPSIWTSISLMVTEWNKIKFNLWKTLCKFKHTPTMLPVLLHNYIHCFWASFYDDIKHYENTNMVQATHSLLIIFTACMYGSLYL